MPTICGSRNLGVTASKVSDEFMVPLYTIANCTAPVGKRTGGRNHIAVLEPEDDSN